jgi:hypothetical protein
VVSSPCFASVSQNGIIKWHINVLAGFISISSLAQDVIIHFAKSSYMSLLEVWWQFVPKQGFAAKRKHFPSYHAHQTVMADVSTYRLLGIFK